MCNTSTNFPFKLPFQHAMKSVHANRSWSKGVSGASWCTSVPNRRVHDMLVPNRRSPFNKLNFGLCRSERLVTTGKKAFLVVSLIQLIYNQTKISETLPRSHIARPPCSAHQNPIRCPHPPHPVSIFHLTDSSQLTALGSGVRDPDCQVHADHTIPGKLELRLPFTSSQPTASHSSQRMEHVQTGSQKGLCRVATEA
jgi:hypothetical protein